MARRLSRTRDRAVRTMNRLPPYQKPTSIYIVPSFPLTTNDGLFTLVSPLLASLSLSDTQSKSKVPTTFAPRAPPHFAFRNSYSLTEDLFLSSPFLAPRPPTPFSRSLMASIPS